MPSGRSLWRCAAQTLWRARLAAATDAPPRLSPEKQTKTTVFAMASRRLPSDAQPCRMPAS
eukprot:scaffold1247_cov170-Ochromonas_danica.AAC.5